MQSLDTLKTQANQLYKDGKFQEAAVLFEEIAHVFYQQGNFLQAAEEKNNSSVSYLKSGNPQKAYELAQFTDEVFAQANDSKRQAIAIGNQAAALYDLGKLNQALDLYQKCSEILADLHENELRGYVLQQITAIQVRQGNQLEALATAQAALRYKQKKSLPEKILSWLNKFIIR